MSDDLRQRFLDWRRVEEPCAVCDGSGVRSYASTATWRGGMGGASITADVCDACWGSGDRDRHGADLRKLRDASERATEAAALAWLTRQSGATFSVTHAALNEAIRAIEGLERRRKIPAGVDAFWFRQSLQPLTALLRTLRDTAERHLGKQAVVTGPPWEDAETTARLDRDRGGER